MSNDRIVVTPEVIIPEPAPVVLPCRPASPAAVPSQPKLWQEVLEIASELQAITKKLLDLMQQLPR